VAAAAALGPFLGYWDAEKGCLTREAAASVDFIAQLSRAPSAAVSEDDAAAAVEGGDGAEGADAGLGTGQRPRDLPFTFLDFSPIMLQQYSGGLLSAAAASSYVAFPSFDALVDEYFSRLDVVKAERNEAAARAAASRKLQRLREGHGEAVASLEAAQVRAYAAGALVQAHAAAVNAACTVVRSALEHGVDWGDLARLVSVEQAGGNPIAKLIVSMDLPKHTVRLALRDEEAARAAAVQQRMARAGGVDESDEEAEDDGDGEEDDEEEAKRDKVAAAAAAAAAAERGAASSRGGKGSSSGAQAAAAAPSADPFTFTVAVDVWETADANARRYFEEGKSARARAERTQAAATHVLKRAERTTEAALAKQVNAASAARAIRAPRVPAWFERFLWFISQEGLVVVAGRNAQDNETLVKRYLRPQDAYVHAETHGAATVLVRNPSPDRAAADAWATRYQLSLEAAGALCICLSSGWAAHVPSGAYWVGASQVSKTAPTGEYLGTGSFMVRGKKTFLPPAKLELGCVLLWKVDPACVPAHRRDRYPRGEGEDGEGEGGGGGEAGSLVGPTAARHLHAAAAAAVAPTRSVRATWAEDGGPGADVTAAGAGATGTGTAGASTEGTEASGSRAAEKNASASDEAPPSPPVADASADCVDLAHRSECPGQADAAALSDRAVATAASQTAPPDNGATATCDESSSASAEGEGHPLAGGGGRGGVPISAHVRRQAKKLQQREGLDAASALARVLQLAAAAATSPAPGPLADASSAASGAGGDGDAHADGGSSSGSEDGSEEHQGHELVAAPTAPMSSGAAALKALEAAAASGKRGAKGKLKRVRARYGDQDEEDRALAMRAIGHGLGPMAAAPATSTQAPAGKAAKGLGATPQLSAPAAAAVTGDGSRAAGGPKKRGVSGGGKSTAAAGAGGASAASVPESEDAADGGGAGAADEDRDKLAAYVAVPRADDVITHVVPMLCPYGVALGCKYRLKLTPGPLKKGKAAGAVMQLFAEVAARHGGTPRELELIKALCENDVINAVVAGCKVQQAAGAAPGWPASSGGHPGRHGGAGSGSGPRR